MFMYQRFKGILSILTLCGILTILCCDFKANAFGDLNSDPLQYSSMPSDDRIRALYYQLGYNNDFQDDSLKVRQYLFDLLELYGEDTEFSQHIDYAILTLPILTEKDVKVKIEFFKALIPELQRPKNKLFLGITLHTIGIYQYVNDDFNEAFEYMINANEIFQEIGYENIPQIGIYLHDFGLCQYRFKYYEKAKLLMLAAIEQPAFSPNLDIQRFNTLAMSYYRLGNSDSAHYYLERCREKAELYNDIPWKGIYHDNIGWIFEEAGDYKNALLNYQKSNAYHDQQPYVDNLYIKSLLNIIKMNLKLGAYSEVEKLLKLFTPDHKGLSHNKDMFYMNQIAEYNQLLLFEIYKDYYKYLHLHDKAYAYADSFYQLQKKIDSKYTSDIIKITESNHLLEQNKLELEKMSAVRRANMTLTILLIILLILGVVTVYLIRARKKRIEIEHELKENELLHRLETHKLRLDNAQEEMKSYVHALTAKNSLIESITKELEKLKSTPQTTQQFTEIESTIERLRGYYILTEDDWNNFQTLFQNYDAYLLEVLRTYKPHLTESEIRYLLLISLELNKKEIADLLGISPDSLRVTWNRLKKKLPASCNEQPMQFIHYMKNEYKKNGA